jgi:hypothetical protein
MADKNSALRAKLAVLAANDLRFDGPARVISENGTPPPLVALLGEIDNSVLERTLVVTLDQRILRLAVAGRRLRGVIALEGGADHALAGQALSQDDPAMVQNISAFLAELCNGAQKLTVQSLPATPLGTRIEAGISARSLASDATPAITDLATFLTRHKTALTACLHLDGDETLTDQGDTTGFPAMLQNQWPALRAQQAGLFGANDAPQLLALGSGDTVTALARWGSESCAMTLAAADLPRLIADWPRL